MTPEKKRRLKKIGKERAEQSSREIGELLRRSNPVGMDSPDYIANEIAIRGKEKALRNTFTVLSRADVERDFLIRPLQDESVEKHTQRFNRFLWCSTCDTFMPVQVVGGAHCRCRNLIHAVKDGRFVVGGQGRVEVVQLIPKVQGESLVRTGERLLLYGGALTGVAALLHVGIILGGPGWYRFFGAGERMAQLAARGSSYPTLVTAGIAAVLGLWALYALSGAGMLRPLPLRRLVLALIAAVYLIRGVAGIPVVLFVDNPYTNELKGRITFMVVSSAICICLGLCYAVGAAGIRQRSRLHV
jgi:putative oxidoreductase